MEATFRRQGVDVGAIASLTAKNLVAEAIKGIVDSYRANALRYVVIVGDDRIVPLARLADHAVLLPESAYPAGGDEMFDAAMEKVRQDKLREVTDGCDGTWVAHPGLVPVAKAVFDDELRRGQNLNSYVCAGCITSGATGCSATNGSKNIHAKLGSTGGDSNTNVYGTIHYDTAGPTFTFGASSTNVASITGTITPTGDGSGIGSGGRPLRMASICTFSRCF